MKRGETMPLFAPPRPTVEQRFLAFHASNPIVYTTLVRLARLAREKGRKRVGIAMLWEAMRWEMFLGTTTPEDGTDPFKLNNNHRSRYARMIMEHEADLAAVFSTRVLRSECKKGGIGKR